MPTPDRAYQAYYLRQHRVLGAYLALHCWHNGYDAVIVGRSTLLHFHELTHLTEEHLSWLRRDIRPYFPQFAKFSCDGSDKLEAVVLSRVELPQDFGLEHLFYKDCAEQWRAKGFRVAALSELGICTDTFTEETAAAFLALVGAGLCIPEPPPPETPATSSPSDNFMKRVFLDLSTPPKLVTSLKT